MWDEGIEGAHAQEEGDNMNMFDSVDVAQFLSGDQASLLSISVMVFVVFTVFRWWRDGRAKSRRHNELTSGIKGIDHKVETTQKELRADFRILKTDMDVRGRQLEGRIDLVERTANQNQQQIMTQLAMAGILATRQDRAERREAAANAAESTSNMAAAPVGENPCRAIADPTSAETQRIDPIETDELFELPEDSASADELEFPEELELVEETPVLELRDTSDDVEPETKLTGATITQIKTFSDGFIVEVRLPGWTELRTIYIDSKGLVWNENEINNDESRDNRTFAILYSRIMTGTYGPVDFLPQADEDELDDALLDDIYAN